MYMYVFIYAGLRTNSEGVLLVFLKQGLFLGPRDPQLV